MKKLIASTCVVVDNSGIKKVRIINVQRMNFLKIGCVVKVSVLNTFSNCSIQSGKLFYALVVRTKSPFKRVDGSYLIFQENAVVILKDDKKTPEFNIKVSIPFELKIMGFSAVCNKARGLI